MYHSFYITNNKGYVLGYILMALAWLSVLGVAAYGVFQTTAGNARLNAKTITDSLVTQALYALVTESNYSGSLPVPPDPANNPYSSESLPADTKAPKKDYWAKDLKYCKNNNPSGLDSIFIAVISSGEDKVFQTTCVNALTGAVNGDDVVKFINGNQMRQGVGGTVYYGDPVEDKATLDALNTDNLKDGELRLVKAEDKVYRYKAGTGWVAISGGSGGTSCPLPGNLQLTGCNIVDDGGCSVSNMQSKIAIGQGYNCMVGLSKKVYCFGRSGMGSGDGRSYISASTPYVIKINATTDLTNVKSVHISTMNYHGWYVDGRSASACAIREDGEVWCWGVDGHGGFAAEGSTTDLRVARTYAVRSMRLCDANGSPTNNFITNAKYISIGTIFGDPSSGIWTFVITEDKKLYFTGNTVHGMGNPDMNFLGLSSGINCLRPIPQFDGSSAAKSAVYVQTDLIHTMVITEDGSVHGACSNNSSGICSSHSNFNAISLATTSDTTCILKNNGTVWCQGGNNNCEWGIGNSIWTTPGVSSSAVKIDASTTLENVVQLTAVNNYFCALTSEGKIYCWGKRTNNTAWNAFGDGNISSTACYATLMAPPNKDLPYSDSNKWKILGHSKGHRWNNTIYLYTTAMIDINGQLYYSGDGINMDSIWFFGPHTYYPAPKNWSYCTW